MSHIHSDHQKCQPVEAKLNFVPYWHQLQKYDGNSSTLVWEAKETPLEYLTSMYHNYCTKAEVAFTHQQHSSTNQQHSIYGSFPLPLRATQPNQPLFAPHIHCFRTNQTDG